MYNSRCSGLCWDFSAGVAGGALLSTGQPAKVTPGFDIWAVHTHAAQCHTYTHTHTQIAKIVHRTLSHTLNVLLGIFFVILELALLSSSGFGRSWPGPQLLCDQRLECASPGTTLEGHGNSLHFDCPVLACQVLETAGLPRMNISLMHPMTAL